jgi:hypothetical protein
LVEKYGPNFLFNDVLIFSIVQVLSVKPVLRGQLWDKEKVRWPLKRGSIYMKCSMTGQEKGDILIQVTA